MGDLLRLADKFDIAPLQNEINVSPLWFLANCKMLVSFWNFKNKMAPTYELWETSAKLGLLDVEDACRPAALPQIAKIIFKGDGLEALTGKGVPIWILTRAVREIWDTPCWKCYRSPQLPQ